MQVAEKKTAEGEGWNILAERVAQSSDSLLV